MDSIEEIEKSNQFYLSFLTDYCKNHENLELQHDFSNFSSGTFAARNNFTNIHIAFLEHFEKFANLLPGLNPPSTNIQPMSILEHVRILIMFESIIRMAIGDDEKTIKNTFEFYVNSIYQIEENIEKLSGMLSPEVSSDFFKRLIDKKNSAHPWKFKTLYSLSTSPNDEIEGYFSALTQHFERIKKDRDNEEIYAKMCQSFHERLSIFKDIVGGSQNECCALINKKIIDTALVKFKIPFPLSDLKRLEAEYYLIKQAIEWQKEDEITWNQFSSSYDICGWHCAIAAKTISDGEPASFDPLTYPFCFCDPNQMFSHVKMPNVSTLIYDYVGFVRRFGVLGKDLAEYIEGDFLTYRDFDAAFRKIKEELLDNKPVIVFEARGHWITLSKYVQFEDKEYLLAFNDGFVETLSLSRLKKEMSLERKMYSFLRHLTLTKWTLLGAVVPFIIADLWDNNALGQSILAADEILNLNLDNQRFDIFNIVVTKRP